MSEIRVVTDGLGFPESTRWHGGRAWVCNWGAGEVLAVTSDGEREVMARLAPQTIPLSIDWLPDGAVWVATVPGQRCVRVREGGEVLDVVAVDRGCFACMLGGADGRTLFIAAAHWHGMQTAMSDGPDWTGQLLAAPDQPAAHAGRP